MVAGWVLLEHGLSIAVDVLIIIAAGLMTVRFWKEWKR